MQYILLNSNNVAAEIIPEINLDLPGFPLVQRYPLSFIQKLVPVEDHIEVKQSWVYDAQTGAFAPPAIPKPAPEDGSLENPAPPSTDDRIAMLKQCIIEMAQIIYA